MVEKFLKVVDECWRVGKESSEVALNGLFKLQRPERISIFKHLGLGRISNLELLSDGSLSDSVHFVLFENQLLYYQSNLYGQSLPESNNAVSSVIKPCSKSAAHPVPTTFVGLRGAPGIDLSTTLFFPSYGHWPKPRHLKLYIALVNGVFAQSYRYKWKVCLATSEIVIQHNFYR
jgi:hypothetical protein